jgi:hypothetical protein
VLAAACGTSGSQADDDALCSGVRADLKGTGLSGTPTQQQAADAGTRLDARVRQVANPGLHDAVVRLHQHVHDIDVAWRKRGPDDVARAVERARRDAEQVASKCKSPPSSFLEG